MNSIVLIGIWITFILSGLALLTMLIFGIRSMIQGKVNLISTIIVVTPLILMVILGLIMGDWARAGIVTVFITSVIAGVALLLSGIRTAAGW